MYMIKSAFKDITQNKARNLIIIGLTAFVFCAIVFSMCAYNGAVSKIADIRAEYCGTVTANLSPVDEAHMGYPVPRMTYEECIAFENYDYVQSVQVQSFIYGANKDESLLYINGENLQWQGWDLLLVGYNMAEANALTQTEDADYLEGRCFSSDDECVVSNVFAQRHMMKLGDSLTVKDISSGISAEFVISGIINVNALEDRFNDLQYNYNLILTSMEGAAAFSGIKGQNIMYGTNQPFYNGYNFVVTLDSPEHFNDFLKLMLNEIKTIDGIQYRYVVNYAKGGYEELAAPLEAVATRFIRLALLFILIFLVVLTASVVINVRIHKFQFGILRSMGMSKGGVCMHCLLEQLMIYLASVVLGGVLGVILFRVTDMEALGTVGYSAAAIGWALKLSLWSLAVTVVTVLISLIYIVRLNPLKILRN